MHEMTDLGVTTGSTSGDCRVEGVEGMRGERAELGTFGYIPKRHLNEVKVASQTELLQHQPHVQQLS